MLILYFIREEFLLTSKISDKNKQEHPKPPIALLYLRTFFEKINSAPFESILEEEELNSMLGETIKLKFNFFSDPGFYKYHYLTLKYKTGKKEYNQRTDLEYNKYVVRLSSNISNLKGLYFKINNQEIIFNNIFDYFEVYPYNFFDNLYIKKFAIENYNYDTDLLEAWAKEKYNFVINSK